MGRNLRLIIVHYHLRPGGIRRIIELATPHLIRRFQPVESIVLACGEADDRKWNADFVRRVRPVPVSFFVRPVFNYVSEQKLQPARLEVAMRRAMAELLDGASADSCLLWAHNTGIGRNLPLTRELVRAAEERALPLIAHHHDWWFDNRWLRWPEMRRAGFRSLDAVAKTIFPGAQAVHHATINHADCARLHRHFPNRAGWLPNLTEPGPAARRQATSATRKWLDHKLGDHHAPVWILPCRLLRRKNVAEALLLLRWLRPEGWLVTTGGVSSADEAAYAAKLNAAARQHHWRLRLAILQGDETGKPDVAALIAASEAVVLTSIQEGFGLPYLEAAAAQRPLIARALPNIAPDLRRFGFRFPQYYEEVLIDPGLFDWDAERQRQARLFRAWKAHLPHTCRSWAGRPVVLAGKTPRPVPFSRLTLTAQLEVLSRPARESWQPCAPLNPFLTEWRARAEAGRLQTTEWPAKADNWLSGAAYAKRFERIAKAQRNHRHADRIGPVAQKEFIREMLGPEHLFPLLWTRES